MGDAVILLVEDYPCESEDQARSREAFYILNNPCVNKNIPGRKYKEWYEANKENIKISCKTYRDSHKEQLKEYELNRKESRIEYKKQYSESNKERLKEYRESHKDEKKLYDKMRH